MSKVMGIYVKFTKTTHQIWSCHVTLTSNSENVYFLPNSVLNFRKGTKFGGNWLKNKKLQANQGGGNNPLASDCRVKMFAKKIFLSTKPIQLKPRFPSHQSVSICV